MKKRLLSVVLLLSLLSGWVPAAQAESAAEKSNQTVSDSITVVNPLYQNVLEENSGLGQDQSISGAITDTNPTISDSVTKQDGKLSAGAETYTQVADAAAFVRSQMANRQATVVLSYCNVSADDQKVSIVKSIVAQALAETDSLNEGDYLRWQYGKYVCNIQGNWISNGDGTQTYRYKFIYSFTYYTTAAQERELNAQISSVLSSLELNGCTSYQQIKKIYAYICSHVTYDYDALNDSTTGKYTAYNAMMKGTAVCQGYALLLYRMLREAGFSSRLIAGTSTGSGENHAWNIVKFGDQYYYMDSTWDAGEQEDSYDYFLKGTTDFAGHEAWADYTSESFQSTYPIAETGYAVTASDTPDANAGIAGSGTCGDNIAWKLTQEGALTLSGTGKMTDYSADGAPWTALRSQIKTLDIGCGITTIGANAFQGCTALAGAVVLPDSITKINAGAFSGDASLHSVDVMPKVTLIAEDAFTGCDSGFVLRGCTDSTAQTAATLAGITFTEVKDIAAAKVALSQQTYTYSGNACTPTVSVTALDDTAVSAYTVGYSSNINAGTAQMILAGTDTYGGKISMPFTIEKAVPDIPEMAELTALRGQTLRDVLLSCRFSWNTPEQSVGMETGEQTFLLTYTPKDTKNYTVVTNAAVTVSVYDTIGLSRTEAKTCVGAQIKLIASRIPNNGPQDLLSWTSSDTAVAQVDTSGTVTAAAEGSAVITVKSTNGECAQCTISVVPLPFEDVTSSDWYYNAVSYAYGTELFAGVTPTDFQPKQEMTRAMLVQVLYNLEGKPAVTEKSIFEDVSEGKWYTNAVVWATQDDVVAGMGNGKFEPDANVTRQQTAQILYNYAQQKQYSVSSSVSISSYDDDQLVANWAIHAMQWAVGSELISGVGNNLLDPRGYATRAQVAQIMMKFDYNIVFG